METDIQVMAIHFKDTIMVLSTGGGKGVFVETYHGGENTAYRVQTYQIEFRNGLYYIGHKTIDALSTLDEAVTLAQDAAWKLGGS